MYVEGLNEELGGRRRHDGFPDSENPDPDISDDMGFTVQRAEGVVAPEVDEEDEGA